jgi:precorrin-2/cobalt-factor-2 C20-methyltransferase
MKTKGTLYGVSVGPGDPQLITMQAHELLQRDAAWAYPVRNMMADSYAFAIVQEAGLKPPAEHFALVFPMTHERKTLEDHWQLAADTVLRFLRKGRDVMFLVEGDASTYSTFGHLARRVRKLNSEAKIEIVAGVSSFNAAAARLDFPLAEVDDTMAVLPANYGIKIIDHMLDEFDTLVLMKIKPMLDEVIDLLEKRGIAEHAAFIERAGKKDERIVHDVTTMRGQKVNYLSLMLVKNPKRQKPVIERGCGKKKHSKKGES